MGVPKFYRWISERYPCLSQNVKEYQIPEFDNLYLDMNGIIHTCSHPDDANAHFRITEEQIFLNIMHYIEVLFAIIKPKKLFFMAIDGVAPRAKMNQQRARRFRSARDAEELIRKALNKGEKLPETERFDSNCITPGTRFMAELHRHLQYFVARKISTDAGWQQCTVILSGHQTPGEGEHKIMDYIRYLKCQSDYDPSTRHCLYGLDADLIMLGLITHELNFSLLREEVRFGRGSANAKRASSPEETTFHLLHLSLLREYIDHEFEELKAPNRLKFDYDLERVIDDWVLLGFLVGNDFVPHLPNMHIQLDVLPYLWSIYKSTLPDLDGYLNESGTIVLRRFEIFMRKLDHFELNECRKWLDGQNWLGSKREEGGGGCRRRPRYMPPHLRKKNKLGGALLGGSDSQQAEERPLESFFNAADESTLKEELLQPALPITLNSRAPMNPSEESASARAAAPDEGNATYIGLFGGGGNGELADSSPGADAPAATKEELELPVENLAGGLNSMGLDAAPVDWEVPADQDADDEEKGRITKEGHWDFKFGYYKEKFHINATPKLLRQLAEDYIRALQWILGYYYNGVPSWGWFYQHHYSPHISDVKDIMDFKIVFELGQPFSPYEQLMAVLPPASGKLLPFNMQLLMNEPTSPIIDFYPRDFETDLNGKTQDWEALVLIPFIDEGRLTRALAPLLRALGTEELERNRHKPHLSYSFSLVTQEPYPGPSSLFPTIIDNHARVDFIEHDHFRTVYQNRERASVSDLANKLTGHSLGVSPGPQVPAASLFLSKPTTLAAGESAIVGRTARTERRTMPGFQLLSLVPHSISFEHAAVRVFQQASRGSNMMLTITQPFPRGFVHRRKISISVGESSIASDSELNVSPDKAAGKQLKSGDVMRLAKTLIGNRLLVGWPHTFLALVVSVSTHTLSYNYQMDDLYRHVVQNNLTEPDMRHLEKFIEEESERYKIRFGIKVGDTQLVIYARPIVGRKVICNKFGKLMVEPVWSESSTPFLFQTCVPEDAFSQSLWQRALTPNELFRPGATVFLLKPVQCLMQRAPRYGGTTITSVNSEIMPYGERAEVAFVNQSQLRLRVFLEPEPALDAQHFKFVMNKNVEYLFASGIANQLGVSALFVTRITGMVYACDSKSKKGGTQRGLNVGLNIRNPRSQEQVIGYSRCLPSDAGASNGAPRWVFSYRVADLIRQYHLEFPALYAYLLENSGQTASWRENIYAEDLVAYVKRFVSPEQLLDKQSMKQKSSKKTNKQTTNSAGANGLKPPSLSNSISSSPSDSEAEDCWLKLAQKLIRGAHEFIAKQAYSQESEIKYRYRVPAGSHILDEKVVVQIERLVCSYQEALTSNRTLVVSTPTGKARPAAAAAAGSDSNSAQSPLAPLSFPFFYERDITVNNPSDVYLPTAQFSDVLPDPVKSSRCFQHLDRVVNVGIGGLVPLGLRGTIIGRITTGPRENDIIYEVLFDREFPGALRLHGAGPRCYRLGPHSLLNLSAALREVPPQRPPPPDSPIYIHFHLMDEQQSAQKAVPPYSLELRVKDTQSPQKAAGLPPLLVGSTPPKVAALKNAIFLSECDDVNIAQKTYKRNSSGTSQPEPNSLPQSAFGTVSSVESDQTIGIISQTQLISPTPIVVPAPPPAAYSSNSVQPVVSQPSLPREPVVTVQVLQKRSSRARSMINGSPQQPSPPSADKLLVQQTPQNALVETTTSLPSISSVRLVNVDPSVVAVALWDEAATAPLPPRQPPQPLQPAPPTVVKNLPASINPPNGGPITRSAPPPALSQPVKTVASSSNDVVAPTLNNSSLPEAVQPESKTLAALPQRPSHKHLQKPVKKAFSNLRNAIFDNLPSK